MAEPTNTAGAQGTESAEPRRGEAQAVFLVDDYGTITGWSDIAAALFGRSTEEAVGRPAAILQPAVQAAALRNGEDDFRRFFDALDDIILVGSPDGRLLYSNKALTTKLGYTAHDLAAMHLLELHPAEKRAEAEAIFGAMLAGEREVCRLPLQRTDGRVIAVETRVSFGRWGGEDCVFSVSKDLTEEQESLQRFSLLFNSNPCLMAVTDVDENRYTEVNQAFLDTIGYSREEIIGRTASQIGLLVSLQQRDDLARKLQADGRISGHEMQVRCKDGTLRDGVFAGEVIEIRGRRYFLTVMIDVTDQRQARQELAASERRLRSILDTTPAIICIYDTAAHRITAMNRSVERILGYDAATLQQLEGVPDVLLPEDQAAVSRAHMRELRSLPPGEVVEWETTVPSAQGEPLRLRLRATMFPQADAETATSILFAGTDVTLEHRQRTELEESEERLRLTLDSLLDAHAYLEAVRDRDGRIVDFVCTAVNKMGCEYSGLNEDELIGKPMFEFRPALRQSVLFAAYCRTIETGEPLMLDDVNYGMQLIGGTDRRYDVRAVRLGDGVSCMWRDVTARHVAERAIRRRVAELDGLQRISSLLVRRFDLDGALDSICDLLLTLLEARSARVRLLPEPPHDAGPEYVAGEAALQDYVCSAESGAILAALSNGEPFEAVCEDGPHVLAVPLIAIDETVGVLSVAHRPERPAFSKEERAFALTIADLLAAVVQTERLHEVATQQAAQQQRDRLARDLHDSVTQNIYSANLMLEAALSSVEGLPDARREELELVRTLVKSALAELRILVFELRPETLAVDSVQTLLRRLSEALASRTAVELELDIDESLDLPEDVRVVMYRVAQEAVSNITRHSRASRGCVSLKREGQDVRLVVRDDGSGFDPSDVIDGMGHSIMDERAASIGARLQIESTPEDGTMVTMTWRDSGERGSGRSS